MSEITKRIEKMHEGQILFISDFSDLNGTFLQTQREDSGGVRCEQNRYFIFSKLWISQNIFHFFGVFIETSRLEKRASHCSTMHYLFQYANRPE